MKNRRLILFILFFLTLILYFISPAEIQATSNLTLTWISKSPMPTARYQLVTAQIENKIYAIGGRTTTHTLQSVESFNLTTNTWTIHANLPYSGEVASAVTIGNKIFVVSGASLDQYDPATDSWTTLGGRPHGSTYPAVETANGKIYVIDGPDGSFEGSFVDEYDPITNSWNASLSNIPTPRTGATAVTYNGKIYIFGGIRNDPSSPVEPPPLSIVEVYDPVNNSWESKARAHFKTS